MTNAEIRPFYSKNLFLKPIFEATLRSCILALE
jgi:hypothetical protein